jgi:hypothetical protein
MSVAQLLVFSNAVDGKEEEFERWYDEQHIPDVLQVPGIIAAQRFETRGGDWKFCTVYELDTADIDAVLADLVSRAGTDRMVMSDAIDAAGVNMVPVVAVRPRVSA